MSTFLWLSQLRRSWKKARQPVASSKRSCRLSFETLEERCTPNCATPFVSGGVLTLNCDNSDYWIQLDRGGGGEFIYQVLRLRNRDGSGLREYGFYPNEFSSTLVNTGAGHNRVDIYSNFHPLTVNGGGGLDDVVVGSNNNIAFVGSPITVQNPPTNGYTTLFVANQGFNGSVDATVTGTRLTLQSGSLAQQIDYHQLDLSDLTLDLGNGGSHVNVINTPQNGLPGGMETGIVTGGGLNFLTVSGTTGGLLVRNFDFMNITDNGSVQGIRGRVRVDSAFSVTVDDPFDAAFRNATLDTVVINGSNYGEIRNLAPALIQYSYVSTNRVLVNTGMGGATVNVLATGILTNLVGNSANTTVNVGNGSVQNIRGDVYVDSTINHRSMVNVDDRSDSMAHPNVTLDNNAQNAILSGLAPATIFAWSRATPTSVFTVFTGIGPATVNVLSTSVLTNVTGYGPLTVNVGNAGRVQGIQASLSLSDPGGRMLAVNVNDQNDPASQTVTLDTITTDAEYARITGTLMPATIYTRGRDTNTLNVSTGIGGATVNVLATPAPTNVLGNGSNNTLVGPNTPTGFNISGLNAGTLSGGVSASFSNFQNLIGGSGGDAFIFADGAGVSGNISNNNDAASTLDYSAYSTSVTVDLSANRATGVGGSVTGIVTLRGGTGNDSLTGNAAGQTIFVASPGNDTLTGLGISNSLYNTDANGTADSTWNVTAQNSGTLTFIGGTTTFSGMQNLDGGGLVGAAAFVFADGAGVDGVIQCTSRTNNSLNYSAYSTNVYVNLQTGVATGVAGGIVNIQNVTGASGGAPGSYNILVGNGGNVLTGGTGRRNLLVAGGSGSTLQAGDGWDILIAGTTMYDQEAGMVSLGQIMDFWSAATDYNAADDALAAGVVVPLLDATTVSGPADGNANTLIGGTGPDLFFGNLGRDNVQNYDPNVERLINLP